MTTAFEIRLSRRVDALQLELHTLYVALHRCQDLIADLVDLSGMPRESPQFAEKLAAIARAREHLRESQ